jgi:hypothetical protein
MKYINVDGNFPDYIKSVLRGSRVDGYYLPDNLFYRRLLETVETTVISREQYKTLLPNSGLIDCQNQALGVMLNNDRQLINLSPGLGKTYLTSHYLNTQNTTNVLIVAPKPLHYVWSNHLRDLTAFPFVVRPNRYDGERVTITNIQQLDKIDFKQFPDILIIDESILVKNRKSKNFKLVKNLSEYVRKIYLLSGSPYSKNISDLWSQLNLLFPRIFTSYWDFAKIFCRVVIDRYGWKIAENRENIEPILSYSLQDFMFSAHIDDNSDLPEISEYILDIEPSKLQLTIEKELRGKGAYKKVLVDGPLSLLTRLKQLSLDYNLLGLNGNTEKRNALLEMLEFVEKPCIIASSSNPFLYGIAIELKDQCTIFTADYPNGYSEYIDGHKDIMLMQVASGKFGHSFTNTKTMIICDYTFNSDDFYQLKARVKRLTTKQPVTIYHLHSMKIDRKMYKLIQDRNLSVDNLMKELYEDTN